MLNTLVRPVMVGASTFCFVALSAVLPGKILAVEPAQPIALLLPLESRSMSVETQAVALDQFADTFNQQMDADRVIADQPMRSLLASIPLLSDFVNDAGKLDLDADLDIGMNFPISVDVSNVMGKTGLIVSADFNLH